MVFWSQPLAAWPRSRFGRPNANKADTARKKCIIVNFNIKNTV